MTDTLWAVAAGLALGILFYGGLWWTVIHASSFRWPAAALLTSAALRIGVALGVFYGVAGGGWSSMLVCLLGVLASRWAVTWATRLPSRPGPTEARHAP